MATSAPTELEFTGRESTVDVLKTMTKQLVDNTHAMKELKDKLLLESQTKVSFEREELVNVRIKVTFLKIGMIDFVRNLYEADVFIECRWPDPAMSTLKSEDLKLLHWKYFWDPKLVISNMVGSALRDKLWNTNHFETDELVVIQKRHLRAVFRAEFDLSDFPADVQELPLLISSERSSNSVQLEADTEVHEDDENASRSIESSEKEWRIFDTQELVKVEQRSLDAKHQNSEELKASCFVGRDMKYYCTNVIIYIVLIQLLSFTSLGVAETQSSSRDMTGAGRLIVIFLNIAILFIFKYIAFVKLPYVKAITYLDIYVLGSFVFLCGFTLPGALYGIWSDGDSDWDDIEAWGIRTGYTALCFIIMAAIFIVFNAVFWLVFVFKACDKRRKLDKKVNTAKKLGDRAAKEERDQGKEEKSKGKKKKDKKEKKHKKDQKTKPEDGDTAVEIEQDKPEKSGLIELETSGV